MDPVVHRSSTQIDTHQKEQGTREAKCFESIGISNLDSDSAGTVQDCAGQCRDNARQHRTVQDRRGTVHGEYRDSVRTVQDSAGQCTDCGDSVGTVQRQLATMVN